MKLGLFLGILPSFLGKSNLGKTSSNPCGARLPKNFHFPQKQRLHTSPCQGEKEFLRLVLNTLYATASGQYDLPKIKAAFEMRAASILGFMPMLEGCHYCGRTDGEFFLDVMNGVVLCEECQRNGEGLDVPLTPEDIRTSRIICPLSASALAALLYTAVCPLQRLFSFRLDEADMPLFAASAEKYLLNHLERGFKSLDFYKQICD